MNPRCPACGGRLGAESTIRGVVACPCGEEVWLFPVEFDRPGPTPDDRAREEQDEIARGADRIVNLILYARIADVDLDIAIDALRDRAEELFPGRGELFEMIYAARFERIRRQWPPEDGEPT